MVIRAVYLYESRVNVHIQRDAKVFTIERMQVKVYLTLEDHQLALLLLVLDLTFEVFIKYLLVPDEPHIRDISPQ